MVPNLVLAIECVARITDKYVISAILYDINDAGARAHFTLSIIGWVKLFVSARETQDMKESSLLQVLMEIYLLIIIQ